MQKIGIGLLAVLVIVGWIWTEITLHPADQHGSLKTGNRMPTDGHYPTTVSSSPFSVRQQRVKGSDYIENQDTTDATSKDARISRDFPDRSYIPLLSGPEHPSPPDLQSQKSFGPPIEIGEYLDADDTESIITPIGPLDTHEIGESLDADNLLSYETDWDIDNPVDIGSNLDADSIDEANFESGNSTIEIGPALNADD